MSDLEATGRPRILLLAMLVVLIGSFGALVLAPLLDAPRPPGPLLLDASLGIEGPPQAPRGEDALLRVFVAGADGTPIGLEVLATAPTDGADLARQLATQAVAAGLADARAEGPRLHLPAVRRVDFDAGRTGAVLSLAVSPQDLRTTSYRLACSQPGAIPLAARRVALVASPLPTGGGRGAQIEVDLLAGEGTPPSLRRIANALMAQGWGVEYVVPDPEDFRIDTLPDGAAPHGLLLTVGAEPPGAAGRWSLGIAD